MYRSSTSLLRPLQLWPLRELINLSHMQHVPNMWNDLAKAMKASDRKKCGGPLWFLWFLFPVVYSFLGLAI